MRSLLAVVSLLLCPSMASDPDFVTPSISNASGVYYLSDMTTLNSSLIIKCNNTGPCFIKCSSPYSCASTSIIGLSQSIDIQCLASSSCTSIGVTSDKSSFSLYANGVSALFNADIRVTNSPSVVIKHGEFCGDCAQNEYYFDNIDDIQILHMGTVISGNEKFTNNYRIDHSTDVNVTCSGYWSCRSNSIDTSVSANQTSVKVNCMDDKACQSLEVIQGPVDDINIFCIEGVDACVMSKFTISPLFNHAHIVCNGTAGSGSCNFIKFIVPSDYQSGFLSAGFVSDGEENDTDLIPYAGSVDGVRINCVFDENVPNFDSFCTNYSSFPLLYGASTPTSEDGDKVYFGGNYSYRYQFKSIRCESGQECFIDCNMDRTCSNTLIECDEGSVCHIYCREAYSCDNIAIKAYGDNVELVCGAFGSCNDADIWLLEGSDNNNVNVSSCNEHKSCENMRFLCRSEDDWNNVSANTASVYPYNDCGYQCLDDESGCCAFERCDDDDKFITPLHLSGFAIAAIVIAVLFVVVVTIGAVFIVRKRQKQETAKEYQYLNEDAQY